MRTLSLVLLGSLVCLGRSATLYDSLGGPFGGADYNYSGEWYAQQFKNPGAATSIDLRAEIGVDYSPALLVSVFTDSHDKPGSLVGSFTTPGTLPGIAQGRPAGHFGGTVAIGGGRTYWIVARSHPTGDAFFQWDYLSGASTGPGASNLWAASTDQGHSWTATDGAPYRMHIETVPAAPVPEPSALIAVGLGLAVLRRRQTISEQEIEYV